MIEITGQPYEHQVIFDVAVKYRHVKLAKKAKINVERTRKAIEQAITRGEIIYGVTTGLGALKDTIITPKDTAQLQTNLIMSHAVGVGAPFEQSVVRGMMFLIANYLAKGYSGVRPVVIETLIQMLNKGVCPIIPQQGSVGSSGDLAPSAHLVLVLTGIGGEAQYGDKTLSGHEAMKQAGITPVVLQAKEGLALINNTACMTSLGALTLAHADQLIEIADLAGALSAEALRATPRAFDPDVHHLKPHDGQIYSAAHVRRLLEKSTMLDHQKIQDQYSLRCIPQIHGAVREALQYVTRIVTTEVNSVTDNPLIFQDDTGAIKVVSAGNFHGESIAICMDTFAIALSELANVSDRRIASLLDPATNHGLPPFLTPNSGVNSGLMILQYTTAALVSENKVLAHPSSVDSIPTSANIEDLVSMGTIGARKARTISVNVSHVLAIELLVACQAIEFRLQQGLRLGKGTQKAYERVRQLVPYFPQDTVYYPYVQRLASDLLEYTAWKEI